VNYVKKNGSTRRRYCTYMSIGRASEHEQSQTIFNPVEYERPGIEFCATQVWLPGV
uniref:Uncharacterized protein n=1 Tax=Pristionchus pacificus TaxID=54126 RepID=A0A2A6D195_PRIPA